MITWALNEDGDIAKTINEEGVFTATYTCGHRSVYQLVRQSLLTTKQNKLVENPFLIDWEMFTSIGNDGKLTNEAFLAPKILALLSSFSTYVSNVDLSAGTYDIINGTLSIKTICFTSNCQNSQLKCELNL